VERKAFVEQAKQCLREGSVLVALEFARQAYEMDSEDEEVLCVLGAALSYADRNEEAEETLLRAVALHPKSVKSRYNLAVHYYRWGRKEEAWQYARTALELDPGHERLRNLVRLLEEERKLPPVQEAPSSLLESSAPSPSPSSPPRGEGERRSEVSALPRSPHLFGFIEDWGSKWDGSLWGFFVLWAMLYFWVFIDRLVRGFRWDMSDLLDMRWAPVEWLMGVMWVLWVGMLVVDMIDRRPNALAVFFGVGAILSVVGWCCLPAMAVGGLCFVIYYLSSRERIK
jgi:tetratricopeptide (TPR) repeat protein